MAIRNVARMERIDIRGGEDLPRFATLNAGYEKGYFVALSRYAIRSARSAAPSMPA